MAFSVAILLLMDQHALRASFPDSALPRLFTDQAV
jgi:hypothetical protein